MSCTCNICLTEVDAQIAPLLTLGGYGNPRYLCDDCAELMETVTRGTEYSEIDAAMDELGRRMEKANTDDTLVLNTVTTIFKKSADRAESIKEGSYDFALDDMSDDEAPEEIPPELQETEEDKLLDEQEKEETKKWDRITTWVNLGLILAAAGFLLWYLLK